MGPLSVAACWATSASMATMAMRPFLISLTLLVARVAASLEKPAGDGLGGGQPGRVEGEKKRGGEDGGWLVKAMREQGEKGGGVGCFAAVREDTVERCKLQEECRQDAFGGIQWSSAVRGVKHSPRGSKAPPG